MPLFLATDTHWSPVGVAVAARARWPRRSRTWTWLGNARRSTMRARRSRSRASATRLPCWTWPSAAKRSRCRRSPHRRDGLGRPDANAEILLLGDSFANIYSLPTLGWGGGAGLAAQLSAELGRPVDTLTINDNGSYATRAALASAIRRGPRPLGGQEGGCLPVRMPRACVRRLEDRVSLRLVRACRARGNTVKSRWLPPRFHGTSGALTLLKPMGGA